jgi:hypothetical protein
MPTSRADLIVALLSTIMCYIGETIDRKYRHRSSPVFSQVLTKNAKPIGTELLSGSHREAGGGRPLAARQTSVTCDAGGGSFAADSSSATCTKSVILAVSGSGAAAGPTVTPRARRPLRCWPERDARDTSIAPVLTALNYCRPVTSLVQCHR